MVNGMNMMILIVLQSLKIKLLLMQLMFFFIEEKVGKATFIIFLIKIYINIPFANEIKYFFF